jgi:hypothetical protein
LSPGQIGLELPKKRAASRRKISYDQNASLNYRRPEANSGGNIMSISKRAAMATGASVVIGFSVIGLAQAQTAQPGKKSSEVATMGEGEAVMIGPKGERIHKSNVKVTAAQHEAAMKKGAREIKPGAVIYKQRGKLYMLEEPTNETFHDVFENF